MDSTAELDVGSFSTARPAGGLRLGRGRSDGLGNFLVGAFLLGLHIRRMRAGRPADLHGLGWTLLSKLDFVALERVPGDLHCIQPGRLLRLGRRDL